VRQMDRQADIQKARLSQTDRQTDRHSESQTVTGRQTDTQKTRLSQTDRHTHAHVKELAK
jgi:hypothetical protein